MHAIHRLGPVFLILASCGDDSRPRPEAGATDQRHEVLLRELSLPGEPGTSVEAGRPGEQGTKKDGAPAAVGLAAKYPGDVGIDKDPAVVFHENFEEGSVGAVVARYESKKNQVGMALVADIPPKSSGKVSMKMTAYQTSTQPATDLYKQLATGHDQLFLRYYVKYQAGITFHHTGVWLSGYNPPTSWPDPRAGLKPTGSDRFSVAIEPMAAGSAANPRLDFYNYWMKMHSWMDQPSGDGAYWGNTLVHQKGFRSTDNTWFCVEIKLKLNPGAGSGAGAELAVWKDDQLIQHFTDQAPVGYWIKDKFCPQAADSPECTNYPPPSGTKLIPLDLQFRTTTALKINSVWPQNYITEGPAGSVWYDDMVVATTRIGCLR